jgi:hypothetical protein
MTTLPCYPIKYLHSPLDQSMALDQLDKPSSACLPKVTKPETELIERGKKFRRYCSKKHRHKRVAYQGKILRERRFADEPDEQLVVTTMKALGMALRPDLRKLDPRDLVGAKASIGKALADGIP